MSSIQFKVTIPRGSLLEKELAGKTGVARTQRMYFLAELGAEQINRSAPLIPAERPIVSVNTDELANQEVVGDTNVAFPMNDLINL